MKFDAAVEFVRVRILNLSPTTVERKRDDALLDEILKCRYSRSKGIASSLRLKFRRWSMGKEEREVIVDNVLRTVRIRGGVLQPPLRLSNSSTARMRDTARCTTLGAQTLLPLAFRR